MITAEIIVAGGLILVLGCIDDTPEIKEPEPVSVTLREALEQRGWLDE